MNPPLVSIVMPLYNAAGTVKAAVNSIIQQSFLDWELILLDDGSDDNGLAIIAGVTDPRIRIYSDGIHRGISYRLNQGIELAKGKYFARMDSDDIAFPMRIEKQAVFMEGNPDIDLIATNVLLFKNDAAVLGIFPVKEKHDDICARPWNGFYMAHPTWLGRIEWFHSNRYRSFADKVEDQDLLFRTYKHSRFACLQDVLLGYRQDHRILRKMFATRKAYARSFAAVTLQEGRFWMFLLICLNFSAKVLADFLSINLGLKGFRNPLFAVEPELLREWHAVWQRVHAKN